jgi:hypothetical protein
MRPMSLPWWNRHLSLSFWPKISVSVLDSNAGPELLVFSHPVPVLAVVGHILDVGVVIKMVRPVVAHRRF